MVTFVLKTWPFQTIRLKAKDFGESLEIVGLSSSSGWLQGFKKRLGIKVRDIYGVSASVNAEVVEDGRRKLRDVLHGYSSYCIYDMDVTGLFFLLEPNKILATGTISGTKKCKQHVIVALYAPMQHCMWDMSILHL